MDGSFGLCLRPSRRMRKYLTGPQRQLLRNLGGVDEPLVEYRLRDVEMIY